MSALGQKQTCAVQNVMSALPPIADMCSATSGCPLCANSGHNECHSITASARTHVRRWRAGEKIFTHGREEIDHF